MADKQDNNRTKTVSKTIRISPDEFEAVQLRAIKEGKRYSDVIREAIRRHLKLKEN